MKITLNALRAKTEAVNHSYTNTLPDTFPFSLRVTFNVAHADNKTSQLKYTVIVPHLGECSDQMGFIYFMV